MQYNDDGLWKYVNFKVTDTLPVGTIIPFAGSTLPANYMECDGRAISRTEYATLFSAIGTTYGEGDGSTTFNLPNLKGKIPVGQDSSDTDFVNLGTTGGEKTHTLTRNEMPSHSHEIWNGTAGRITINGSDGGNMYNMNYNYGKKLGGQLQAAPTGGGAAHNNLQPYMVIRYVIKVLEAQAGGTRSETLPVGSEVEFEGNVSDIPIGWEQINDIIESGSNANGTYVKYEDGTLVCSGVANITDPTFSDWYGFCRVTSSMTITLPYTAINSDFTISLEPTSYGYFSAIIREKTTSTFTFRALTHNNATYNPGNGTFDFIVIGRWK